MSEFPPGLARGLLDEFRGKNVLVLGDVMLDRYTWGVVTRISPEAPVPIVEKQRTSASPGGAANLAANISALGGTALLVGLLGDDAVGEELRSVTERAGMSPEHLITVPGRPTTAKTRIVAHNQHVVRVDEEDRSDVSDAIESVVVEKISSLLPSVQAIAISDYAKGLITVPVATRVIGEAARRCIVVVDPKGRDYSKYEGAHLLAPNRAEVLTAAGFPPFEFAQVPAAAQWALETLKVDALLVTESEEGMRLFERGKRPEHIAAVTRNVYDVTGAGDTVMAALSLAVAAGGTFRDAAFLGNLAAGLAVERVGTGTVTLDELREAL